MHHLLILTAHVANAIKIFAIFEGLYEDSKRAVSMAVSSLEGERPVVQRRRTLRFNRWVLTEKSFEL